MKNSIILTAFFILIKIAAQAQGTFDNRKLCIRKFITSAYIDKKDASFIINNYMYSAPDDTIHRKKKEALIAALLGKLISETGSVINSSDYKISKYAEFAGKKVKFNTSDDKNFVVLSVKNKPIIYFAFKGTRIISFYHINKGSLSYFLIA
ncbi:hypothetical protein FPZ43_09260 [Mucilaginibacter pallidiroseus]|uniref:Uncharacterized protein n=1 Tax=Mucilaginibacter pallidiroseus TaxID=2599295 RepID=A0A563UF90_9SPHI|nr:hypothetical protein [Mucilaginibacter pallidiroseus]TWR30024.1 hypothetical protein FPZ43_09260 [Mucilaginibacter pallidiroseus]